MKGTETKTVCLGSSGYVLSEMKFDIEDLQVFVRSKQFIEMDDPNFAENRNEAHSVRKSCRSGKFTGVTAGLAPSFTQGNVIIVSKDVAYDFIVYCTRNSKPCPILDISDPGQYRLPRLGKDIDIRTDVPKYIVQRKGQTLEVDNIVEQWKHDFVTVVTGCSFSFENGLQKSGIMLRHVEESVNVPMFITNRQTVPSGPFHGPLVVSMRPVHHKLVQRAIDITRMYPESHGAPVHYGDPSQLGITDLQKPDFGDPVTVNAEDVPVFWACGVTTQMAVKNANLEQWISHAPGHMLVTDLISEI